MLIRTQILQPNEGYCQAVTLPLIQISTPSFWLGEFDKLLCLSVPPCTLLWSGIIAN